jgi:hypothetical protein
MSDVVNFDEFRAARARHAMACCNPLGDLPMDGSAYAVDVRRTLLREIPALAALTGAERWRAAELIEREVEKAIDDYFADFGPEPDFTDSQPA